MKPTKESLVAIQTLFYLISSVFGLFAPFEGSTESHLGDGRLINYADDNQLDFTIVERNIADKTQQVADCRPVNLPVLGIDFKGNTFTTCYICANGLVKFTGRSYELNPRNFGTYRDAACLAPYWSFVDLDDFKAAGKSKVFWNRYQEPTYDDQSESVFEKATAYGNKILGISDYSPQWIMVITWENLRPKPIGDFLTYGGRNTFQLFLANGGKSDAIAVFIYKDIDWSIGVLRRDYYNYRDAGDLPVVGFNSGQPDDEHRYDNYAKSGTVDVEEVDDYVGNILQERGQIGIDLTRKLPRPPTSAEKCHTWVTEQLSMRRFQPIRRRCRLGCPPTLRLARRALGRGRFRTLAKDYKWNGRGFNFCFFSATWGRIDADQCCYRRFFAWNLDVLQDTRREGSGHWYPYHPFRDYTKYLEDERAYQDCCSMADSTTQSCAEYYSVRPTCGVNFWVFPTTWAALFGDPHFVSLDGKNYTFNGCGWYTYFTGEIPGQNESKLVVQVRTTRVGSVNATGFTAIALKEGDTEVIQVNLNPGGGLTVRVNGSNHTLGVNATLLDSGIAISYENGTLEISTTLGNGLRVNEAANGTFFTFVTAFLSDYQNSSVGLAGKWNGNMEDDFTLPNGNVLPINMNDSDIFYKFGQAWEVPPNEIIYESIDDNSEEYKCPNNFVPIFFDEALAAMDPTLRAQAEAVCDNDVTCLFDIAATNNLAVGQETLSEITTINNEIEEIENGLPRFTQNISTINVTLGQTFSLTLTAEDPNDDELTFDVPNLPPGASFSSSENQLTFVWPVDSAEPANLTFLVQDTKNGSTTMSPNIQLCRCENGGTCFIPQASSEETAAIQNTFVVMSCTCPLGFSGEFCENVRDFCLGELTPPCYPLVTCTNSPTGFTCGECPNGYEGNGQVCSDTNECGGNQTVCDQLCLNSVGSYSCACNNGYSLDLDQTTCHDIDECSQPNDCSQLCNNTIGSYQCYCRIGFLIDSLNPNNCTAKTQCEPSNDCSQICYVDPAGQEKCECNLGYRLQESDKKTCDDINECENAQDNLCSQVCMNTDGSYTCSCLSGYEMISNTACSDINECFTGNFTCNGEGEECENIPGSYRCACSKRLNMVRVNGTCIFRDDDTIVADLAPTPPEATTEQMENAIQITLHNFQDVNYTVEADTLFKDSVVRLLNDFCNENTLRPQDCGVFQNQLYFSELDVKRLPGYPLNHGDDAAIMFYVNYPAIVRNGTIDQAILASIVSAQLLRLRELTGFFITLNTSVVPPSPGTPTAIQQVNAVQLELPNFSTMQWTTFYDTVFRRAVAFALNKYCETDSYSRTEDCKFSDSQSFDLDDVARLPGYPSQNGENVDVLFYVNHPTLSNPVVQVVLASMLVQSEADLETALSQQVTIRTSYEPFAPPTASGSQTANSVVIRIDSYDTMQWTFLVDRRLRKSISSRVSSYCSSHLVECDVQTGAGRFNESDVQRSSSATPSDVGDSIDYSFYVKYPDGDTPMVQQLLASVVNIQLDAIQAESTLFFSLQTPFQPPVPEAPNSNQESNTVKIKIANQQSDQWSAIQDNQFRASIAEQIQSYCTANLAICGVASDQVSFGLSHVTRISSSPVQDGQNATYTFFVDYPSANKSVQRNLLAGILAIRTDAIATATSLELSVQTSTLAPTPPTSTSDQISKAIIVSLSNIQADQWSAIQDNNFRGHVAQEVAEYCKASEARKQECELPGNQASFTTNHVQLVTGYPRQNGTNAELQFYVDYPGGGTMSQEILLLIINEQLDIIQQKTGFTTTIVTTVEPETARPPTQDNIANAIDVVLSDFQADQWSFRDPVFRRNMAEEITAFCGTSSYHREICNISESDVNGFTSDHIERLPDSPTQNGTNSILSFYAILPSGSGSLSKSALATIFTSNQDRILAVESELENPGDSISSDEKPVLTPEQTRNTVPLIIFHILPEKINTLVIVDIRVTVAAKMNFFCFSTSADVCGLITTTARRKKRTENEFTQNDILTDASSVTGVGNDTVVGVVVNNPGGNSPVENDIVEEALIQTLQENPNSTITGLTFGIVNTPTVSDEQRGETISIRLPGTSASEWTLQDDISFRNNMSQAIIQYCNASDSQLATCGLTSAELNNIDFQNVEILPGSPTQDGDDAVLSFFVNLPSGAAMPSELLNIIYSSSPNVITRPNTINATTSQYKNPALTSDQSANLVPLTITGRSPRTTPQVLSFAVQNAVATALNDYCRNNSGASICPVNGTFTRDNVLVQIDPETGAVSLVVINPESNSTIPASDLQDAINGELPSGLPTGETFTVPANPSTDDGDGDVDWPLILGLSIGGALVFLFVIVSVIIGVANNSKATKIKEYGGFEGESQSIYSARGWQFDRNSPYSGSPFASIDAIPGFDEDGLPSDPRPADTHV